jgi:hypothetical protein
MLDGSLYSDPAEGSIDADALLAELDALLAELGL